MKKILSILAVLLLVIVAVSFLLPAKVTVERQITIDAPVEAVFPMVNELNNWRSWMPWADLDPNMEMDIAEQSAGAGAHYTWKGNKDVGEGRLDIVESVENSSIKTSIDFGEMGVSEGFWDFSQEGEQTTVTWGMVSDMSQPPIIGKFMGLKMDSWLGPDFEKGLSRIKEKAETYHVEMEEQAAVQAQIMAAIDSIVGDSLSVEAVE